MSDLVNYTVQDIFGSFLAVILFSTLFIAPGYLVGWLLDLFDFRLRRSLARLSIAMVLSTAISPIVFFLTLRLLNGTLTYLIIAVTVGISLFIHFRSASPNLIISRKRRGVEKRFGKYVLWIAGVWVIFIVLFLTEVQLGDRLYLNVVAHDFSTRVAVINAITKTGVPPINPGYFPGHPVSLTYLYYFWYVLCSLTDQLGGTWVDAREAMVASVAWCGLALMASIALYQRLRTPKGGIHIWKSSLIGFGLILISGADILPVLFMALTQQIGGLNGDMEHWNEQITAWIGSLSWVPHHVAAMLACFAGVMLVLYAQGQTTNERVKAMVVAGVAFASSLGLSVFVTIVFVIFWGTWILFHFLQKNRELAFFMLMAGVVGLVAASPFLLDLFGGGGSGSVSAPLTMAVRAFRPLTTFIRGYPIFIRSVAYLLFLPLNYFLELGFFFIGGLLWLQRFGKGIWQNSPFFIAEIVILAVTLLIGSFVRSTAIFSNDLGWRAWLPGQFVLLIWGVDMIRKYFFPAPSTKQLTTPDFQKTASRLRTFIIIGCLTTLVDVAMLRSWTLLVDQNVAGFPNSFSPDTELGRRTLAARKMYEYINENLPPGSVIQVNPTDDVDRVIGLYADRQIGVSVHTAYGIPVQELENRISVIADVFKAKDWESIDQACRENSIDVLIISDLDPLWHDIPDLRKLRSPLYTNPYYVVMQCGDVDVP